MKKCVHKVGLKSSSVSTTQYLLIFYSVSFTESMGIRISVTWGPGYPLENQMKSLLEGTGKDSAIKFVILWQTVEIVLNHIPGLQHYEVIWHVSILQAQNIFLQTFLLYSHSASSKHFYHKNTQVSGTVELILKLIIQVQLWIVRAKFLFKRLESWVWKLLSASSRALVGRCACWLSSAVEQCWRNSVKWAYQVMSLLYRPRSLHSPGESTAVSCLQFLCLFLWFCFGSHQQRGPGGPLPFSS